MGGKKKGGNKAKPAPAPAPAAKAPKPKPEPLAEPEPEPVLAEAPAGEVVRAPAEVEAAAPAVPAVAGVFDLCDALLKISDREKELQAVFKAGPGSILGGKASPTQVLCYQLVLGRHSDSFESFTQEVKAWGEVRPQLVADNVNTKQLIEYLGVALEDETLSKLAVQVALLENLCPTRKSTQDVCILTCKIMEAVAWGEATLSTEQIEAAIVKLTAYLRGSKAAPVVSRGKYDDFIALVKQWTDDNMPDDDFFYQVTRFLPKDADA